MADLYLDELDEELLARGIRLVRYADDFLVLCKTKEGVQNAVRLTEDVLSRMLLELDEADVAHFDQGFRFLGIVFWWSDILVPFDRVKKPKRVLYMPLRLKAGMYGRPSSSSSS